LITPRNLSESAKTQIVTYQVADLAAAADLADIPIFRCAKDITIVEIGIIPEANSAGIDASNTSIWLVEVGSTAIATKTYDATTTFPTKGVYNSLGAITSADRLEGDVLTLSVTNGGTTADTPVATLQIEFILNENT